MNRHFRLLAYLNEHELAHAYVVFFGHAPARIEINFVGRERLEHVFKCEVVALLCSLPFELVEYDLEYALSVVDLAGDHLLALAKTEMFISRSCGLRTLVSVGSTVLLWSLA